jgi:hypothetical protein
MSSSFLELNNRKLLKFIRELYDIWNYRAQLSFETKFNICPYRDPFIEMPRIDGFFQTQHILEPLHILQNNILDILFFLVNSGINDSYKSLGAFYVLASLTLVNTDAAESLPWLFESVQLIV